MSRALSYVLGIEHTELDSLYHLPDWKERPQDELAEMVREIVANETWIVDGNYGAVLNECLVSADTVVWLDYSFLTVFLQLLARTVRRSWKREELWHGNRETFSKSFFSRDSILWWMITTHARRRRQCNELERQLANSSICFLRFKNPRQADEWLRQLK